MLGLDTAWPHLTQLPKDLNFVAIGTLSITFPSNTTHTCQDIRLGQGHHGFDNNWWIGSKDCISVPETHQFNCKTLDPPSKGGCRVTISPGNSDHEFEVREDTSE